MYATGSLIYISSFGDSKGAISVMSVEQPLCICPFSRLEGPGILLRCPANVLGDKAPSSFADRCHSLWSLHLPPAALPSLPIREVPGRLFASFLDGTRKEGPRQGTAITNHKLVGPVQQASIIPHQEALYSRSKHRHFIVHLLCQGFKTQAKMRHPNGCRIFFISLLWAS